eukprot:4208717-Pyramimonas_sp.AAC.1
MCLSLCLSRPRTASSDRKASATELKSDQRQKRHPPWLLHCPGLFADRPKSLGLKNLSWGSGREVGGPRSGKSPRQMCGY